MREAAISALVSLLGSTATVKRDTNTDALSAREFPVVVITDNGSEKIEYKTGGLADVYLTLNLDLMVQVGKNQSTALNALDQSIKGVIAANKTLNGTVAHATINPQTTGDTQGSDNIAVRQRQVVIFYEASVIGGL